MESSGRRARERKKPYAVVTAKSKSNHVEALEVIFPKHPLQRGVFIKKTPRLQRV